VIEKSTDKELQDKWCPSKEEIESEAGISAWDGKAVVGKEVRG
jgi:hypothetical protein